MGFPTISSGFLFPVFCLCSSSGTCSLETFRPFMTVMLKEKRTKAKSYSEPHYLEKVTIKWYRLTVSLNTVQEECHLTDVNSKFVEENKIM